MSGFHNVFLGNYNPNFSSFTNPIGFDGNTYSVINYDNGTASLTLRIYTDGTWTITDVGWDVPGPFSGNWGNPTTAGAGASLYYRYILNYAADNPPLVTGQSSWSPPGSPVAPPTYTSSWVQGTAGSNIITVFTMATRIGATGSAGADTNYTIQISTSADISGIIAQGSVSFSVTSSSNSPP